MPPPPVTHRRPRRPRSSRPAVAGARRRSHGRARGGVLGRTNESELPGDHRYIAQGNQLAHGDMRVGIMSVTGDGANIQVYAPDAGGAEKVRVSEGDRVDVGRRTVTIERTDTGDGGIAVSIDDPESAP